MRTAFASLIIAAGLVTAAQAQDAAQQAAPAAAAPAADAAQAPAQPATPAVDPAAAAQAQPAAPAEPPPVLPTSGDGAALLGVLEKVCVPIVRGQPLAQVAKANGYKLNRRDQSWTAPLNGDKAYTVTIYDQGSNKNVCRGEVHYAVGQDDMMVKAINVWSFLHQPQLQLQANYVNTDADGIKRVRRSWEYFDQKQSTAVNFSTMKKPDDTPLKKGFDSAEIYYQERTF